MDAFVALLVFQLPKLRSLSLGWNFFKRTEIFRIVFRFVLCENISRAPLWKYKFLERVNFDAKYRQHSGLPPENTMTVAPLFSLLSIRGFTARMDDPALPCSWPGRTPSASTLSELVFSFSREGSLQKVLSVTPAFRKAEVGFYLR
jgi:hypothetical protein